MLWFNAGTKILSDRSRVKENHSRFVQDKFCVFVRNPWGLNSVLQRDLQPLSFGLVLSALGFIFSVCVGIVCAIVDGLNTTFLTL